MFFHVLLIRRGYCCELPSLATQEPPPSKQHKWKQESKPKRGRFLRLVDTELNVCEPGIGKPVC
jgi:hypothetical protein